MYSSILIFHTVLILCQLAQFNYLRHPHKSSHCFSFHLTCCHNPNRPFTLLSSTSSIRDHKAKTFSLSAPRISPTPYNVRAPYISSPHPKQSKIRSTSFPTVAYLYLSQATWWPWWFNALFLNVEGLLNIPPQPLPAFTEVCRRHCISAHYKHARIWSASPHAVNIWGSSGLWQ